MASVPIGILVSVAVQRINGIHIPILALTALGIDGFSEWFKTRKQQALSVIIAVYCLFFIRFEYHYFTDYGDALAIVFQDGLEDGMKRAKELAGDDSLPVIRILPNTPVAVGKGVIMYHTSVEVQKEVLEQVLADLAPAGVLDEVEEKMIETGGTLTGCGPAYMYMFIDALADGAVALGVSRDKALLYAKLTMAGAAELALQSDKEPEELKQNVCSPGGTTIEGVKVLEEAGFHDAAVSALQAAFEKSKKLI